MTAIAGVFGPSGATERVVRAMQARMRRRGTEPAAVLAHDDAVLGVSKLEWERHPDLAGSADVVQHDGIAVAADASLYYRDELRERLLRAGVTPSGSSTAHLLLDAYRRWGAGCSEYLEGDFAFVIWDARQRTAYCCRDGIGLRPLYYGVFDGTLVVASSVAGVLAHPGASDDLNLRAIGATVAGQHYSLGAETSFRSVHVLQSGHAFTWRAGALDGPTRFWNPTAQPGAERLGFAAAADELRELLTRAVAERLPGNGVAAVWMSGGWDSTAVFAAGRNALRRAAATSATRLRPVCISYPKGDPGREDDLIGAVLQHWDTEATWIESRGMPLLDAPERAAAERDEAPALLYGPWNGALAAASRASGARIALDGNGGDQLFGSSVSYLADLLVTLRWVSLARELWTRRAMGWRDLARATVLPLAPTWLLPATAWVRPSRKPLGHYLERPLAPWARPDFVAREGVLEFERSRLPRHGAGAARHEQHWMLTAPFMGWAMSNIAERALTEGVELRSPLLDGRVVAFALGRSWDERRRGSETKRLLRAAMRDLLPAEVLAPRSSRTGITVGYSRYWMRQRLPALIERTFRTPLELEAHGIVDGSALRRAADQFTNGWIDDFTRVHLYHTIEVELWLRARRSQVSAAASLAPAASRDRREAGAARRSQLSHHVSLGG